MEAHLANGILELLAACSQVAQCSCCILGDLTVWPCKSGGQRQGLCASQGPYCAIPMTAQGAVLRSWTGQLVCIQHRNLQMKGGTPNCPALR